MSGGTDLVSGGTNLVSSLAVLCRCVRSLTRPVGQPRACCSLMSWTPSLCNVAPAEGTQVRTIHARGLQAQAELVLQAALMAAGQAGQQMMLGRVAEALADRFKDKPCQTSSILGASIFWGPLASFARWAAQCCCTMFVVLRYTKYCAIVL